LDAGLGVTDAGLGVTLKVAVPILVTSFTVTVNVRVSTGVFVAAAIVSVKSQFVLLRLQFAVGFGTFVEIVTPAGAPGADQFTVRFRFVFPLPVRLMA